MLKKCLIIFSGYNQRAVIAFIRTLELHQIDYAIIAKSKDDPIFTTTYINKIIATRQLVQLDLNEIIGLINKVKEQIIADEYIIAPSTEALNRFLLRNRENIELGNIIIPLVSRTTYKLISDKYSFGKLCKDNGIKVPLEYTVLDEALLPFVAKPKQYFCTNDSIHNPFIIQTEEDKQIFLKECNPSDFYYQEYIRGKSFYLLYYFNRDNSVFKFSQENFIQQPNGKSIVAAVSSIFHNTNESLKYEQLFKSLNFFGLVMVEVKQQGNINYLIEANPRFWGPSQLFVDAGMNFFEAFLHDFGVLEMPPIFSKPLKEFKYFWLGGILKTFKIQKKLTLHQGNEYNLLTELPTWLQSDIYRKPDTFNIFKNELI